MKQLIMAFVTGALVTSGALGSLGYIEYTKMQKQTAQLNETVKKQRWRIDNMTRTQASLQAEISGFKEAKKRGYDQTIGALMEAKENASIEALYTWGVKALAEKDYPRAYFALVEVHKAKPDYEDIATQYPLAEKAYATYQQEQKQKQTAAAYALAFDQQAKGQWAQAKVNYQQALALTPGYKDSAARLEQVNRQLATRTQLKDQAQKTAWLKATYQLAFNHQANGRYAAARDAYQQVVSYAPGYKDAAQRLKTVAAKAPKPAVQAVTPSAPAQATAQNCYAQGQAFGQCAQNPNNPGCSALQQGSTPAACKDNPDFIKGYQSTASRDPNGLLKGLSSMLKQL